MHKVDTNMLKLVPFYVDPNISSFYKGLMTIGATQCVDKNCPFQIYNYLFKNNSQFEQSCNHQVSIIQSILIKGFRWLKPFNWMLELWLNDWIQNIPNFRHPKPTNHVTIYLCKDLLPISCFDMCNLQIKKSQSILLHVKHVIQWFNC